MSKLASVKAIAKVCNISEVRVQQLAKRGIIPKAGRGQYELIPVVSAYIRYLQDVKGGGIQEDPNDYRLKLTKFRAEREELEVQKLRGELVPVDEVKEYRIKMALATKSHFEALPAKLAPVLLAAESLIEIKQILADGVRDALTEYSES